MEHIVDKMGLFVQDGKRKRSKGGENQENPQQSVKCLLLADAQFPTDESDDPETGEKRRWQINRIAKSIPNLPWILASRG